ncbi:MAG: ribosome-associated translation inhibitor RaiA [Actinobacteria bacterium]|nr:MAG: ribosome-associated translation inhibitor RaiA [Actinomycetota bacterium]
MDVTVRGRNIEVSEQLRAAAAEKVARLGRLLQGMDQAEVHFMEEKNPRISEKEVCELVLAGHGHIVRAKAASSDAFTALDQAVAKLEHQLAKLKGKLLGRSHPRRHESVNSVKADEDDTRDREATDDANDPGAGLPTIVKTKHFAIKPMTPEEAALQMDLLGHDFYFFTNADTERAAVVYRRNDGDVGLIDGT